MGWARAVLPVALALVLGACAWLPGGQSRTAPPTSLYVLDPELPAVERPPGSQNLNCGNLLVARPTAAPGYATSQMLYRRRPYELEAFAYNEWVAPPSQMLEPLIRRATQSTGLFKAVLSPGNRADGQLYLESVSVRLLQVFAQGEGSYARVSLQARLYDGNRLLGEHRFEAAEPAAAATPAAGVDAANRAAADLLSELARWVMERASEAGESCRRRPG
jgi:cholesterol transport system auxiliary component